MASHEVCILLNEREDAKAKAADALVSRLNHKNITASRISPTPKLAQVIKTRSPKVIVLDYVIGNITTGLDLITEFKDEPAPKFIFLTDEPSVQVAVEAMRLGAKNYIELSNPQAIDLTVKEIEQILREQKLIAPPPRPKETVRFKNFLAQSQLTLSLVEKAKVAVHTRQPIIVIYGPAGSGRSMLAEAIHTERGSRSLLKSYNWDYCPQSISEVTGLSAEQPTLLALGTNLSLIIDRVSILDGGLLTYIETELKGRWISSSDSYLTLCTTELECANAWQNIFDCPVLTIPPLNQRAEDIASLVRHFTSEASLLSGLKAPPVTPVMVSEISKLDWPKNVKQLRAVIIEAAISAVSQAAPFMEQIIISHSRSTSQIDAIEGPPDPLLLAAMIDRVGDVRIAAAALGIPYYQARETIRLASAGGLS